MGAGPAPRRYRFGVFELDVRSAELLRDGTRLRLRGKPFDLLVFLLERPGELVSRDILRQHLWPSDTFVDFDHGLHAAVNRLRDTLGDRAGNPTFIQTIPRKGYRFIAPVSVDRDAPDPAGAEDVAAAPPVMPIAVPADAVPGPSAAVRRSRTWIVAGIVALLGVALGGWLLAGRARPAGRIMLAVLPLENVGNDPAQAYLAAGVTDEILGQLGTVQPGRLGVIARTTVERYQGAGRSIADIGRELSVQYVLEGSVRREGPRVRITARLIDVRDQTQLWTETFDRDLGNTLQTEHEVALRVASALAMAVLTDPMPRRMPRPEAYDHYLRGRYLRVLATESSLRRAIEHFEQAIALDQEYADAHAGLADALLTMGAPGWEIDPPGPTLTKALDAATRAIALAPRHPEALTVRALARLDLAGDRAGAENDVRDALALNPSLSRGHLYYSSILTVMGRFEEAVREAEAARALDPLNPGAGTTLGIRLYYAGRYQDALAALDRVLEIAPAFAPAYVGRGQALREMHQLQASVQAFEQAVATGDGSTYYDARLGHAQAVAGRRDDARAVLARLADVARSRYVSPFHFALVHAGLGDEADVATWLRRCRDDRSGWMAWLGVEREFNSFLVRPAFAEFVRR